MGDDGVLSAYLAGAPATNPIDAVCVNGTPRSVAETTAVWTPKVERSVAMYRPLALSVTAESVPLVVDIVSVPPEARIAFPSASRSWTVMTTVLVPLAGIVVAADVIALALSDGVPTTVVTVGDCPVNPALSVAVMTYAVPSVVAVVNVTEASPEAFVVARGLDRVPPVPVTLQTSVRPPPGTAVPLTVASCACTVMVPPVVGAAVDTDTR
jgi:hypothetical protein